MRRLSLVSRLSLRTIVMTSVLGIFASSMVTAQEEAAEKKADAAKTDETEEAEEEKPLFEVPEAGTADEYFAFINTVKRTRGEARDRDGMMAHMELQITAVLKACEKIMDGKPDLDIELKVINEKFGALGGPCPSQ